MKKIDFDEVLLSVGGWSQFQNLYYVVLCCAVIFSVFPGMSYIFVARDVKYRCRIDSCLEENGKYNSEWLKNAVPFEDDKPAKCTYYQSKNNSTCTDFNQNVTKTCHNFVFARPETTIVNDFDDLKCEENLWKLTSIGTVNVIGVTVCLLFAGSISDRYGRKSMVIVSLFLSTVLGIVRSYSTSYLMYITLEFFNTAVGSGIYSGTFIMAIEAVGSNKRNLGNGIICMAFTIGHVLLGVAAWQAPSCLAFCFIPESLRWLLSKNKQDKALNVLKLIAKVNRKELKQEIVDSLPFVEPKENDDKENIPIVHVLKNRKFLLRILHCSITWICCDFPYYGLTIQSVDISEDVYFNYMFVSLVEIPAYLIAYIVLEKIGRRKTLAASLLLTGIACIGADFIATDNIFSLVVFLLGKMFVTIAFMTIYIFTAELFPTNVRHSAFSICSVFGGIGTMLAPQVPLLDKLYHPLPLIVFASSGFLAGFLALLFPETLDGQQ